MVLRDSLDGFDEVGVERKLVVQLQHNSLEEKGRGEWYQHTRGSTLHRTTKTYTFKDTLKDILAVAVHQLHIQCITY